MKQIQPRPHLIPLNECYVQGGYSLGDKLNLGRIADGRIEVQLDVRRLKSDAVGAPSLLLN